MQKYPKCIQVRQFTQNFTHLYSFNNIYQTDLKMLFNECTLSFYPLIILHQTGDRIALRFQDLIYILTT